MPSEEQCGLGLSCSVCRMGLRPDSSHTSRPGRRTTPANAAGRRRGLPRALPPMPGTLSLTLPPACSPGTGVECRPELTQLLAWDCSAPALPGKLVPRAFQSHKDILTSCGPQAAGGSGLRVQMGAPVGSSRPCVRTGPLLFSIRTRYCLPRGPFRKGSPTTAAGCPAHRFPWSLWPGARCGA